MKTLMVVVGVMLGVQLAQAQTSGGSQTVTGSLDSRDYTLTVASAHGVPVPAVGAHTYCWQSSVSASVAATVQDGGATWNNTGWTGTGSVPATGSSHITPTIVLTQVASSITWLWQQEVTYTLTVNGGTGDGVYSAGERVTITADAPPAGKEFSAWTGDLTGMADPSSATTSVTMPAQNSTVTATYRDVTVPDPLGPPVVYPNVPRTIYAEVVMFGQPATSGDVLAVYCGDELRGKKAVSISGGKAIAVVTVNKAATREELTFKVWDAETNRVHESMKKETTEAEQLGDPTNLYRVEVTAEPFGSPVVYPTVPMLLIGNVTLFDQPAEAGDVVAVYHAGELRGKAPVVLSGGKALVALTVFTAASGEALAFKVWDSSANLVHDARETLTSAVGEQRGTPETPIPISVSNDIDLSITLQTGWNQVSFNLQLEDSSPRSVFQSVIPQVDRVSGTAGTFKPTYPDAFNTLTAIDIKQGYWVNMTANATLSITAPPIDIAATAVPLVSGWNHMGYLPGRTGEIRTVLSELLAGGKVERIIGKEGVFNPTYPDSLNTLTVMRPGYGYWVKMTGAASFHYENPGSGTFGVAADSGDPFGDPNSNPNLPMTVVAKVTLNGAPAEIGDVLGAFVGAELRAKSSVVLIEGEAYVVLGVNVLQNGELVTFKLWDRSNDNVSDVEGVAVPGVSGSDPYSFPNPLLLNAVSAPTGNLTITTAALPAGSVGAAYSQTLQATGGTLPHSWSISAGSLPAGLSLSTNGTISGTPTAATTANFTVQVTDAYHASSTAGFTLTITSAFAAWQQTKFTPDDVLTGRTTPTADFDRDGLPNLLEYAFGKNPKAADASGIVPNVSGNKMQITFPCDATATDITYTVQASSNLVSWDDIAESVGGVATVQKNSSGCAISDPGTGLRTVTVTEAATFTSRRFLRVKVTSP